MQRNDRVKPKKTPSPTSCFASCFSRRSVAPKSTREVTADFLRQVHGLSEIDITKQLIHLDDFEAATLRFIYKEGLRGCHLYHCREKDQDRYNVISREFLHQNDKFNLYFHSFLRRLIESKVDPEMAMLLLMSLSRQNPEKVMQRQDAARGLLTVEQFCKLYADKSEEEAQDVVVPEAKSYRYK